MISCDPEAIFSGVVLVAAPHMDDEVLACGGTLARLPHKERLHLVYATDGTRSPVKGSSRTPAPSPELEVIRVRESLEAMAVLGIPQENVHFLSLPDGELDLELERLTGKLVLLLEKLRPDQILVPFRYDRHPDHLALYRGVHKAQIRAGQTPTIYEYFVYNRYRLIPGGDIRKLIRPDLLLSCDIQPWSESKRQALKRYRSQTTLYYDWQIRPILPPERVEYVSQQPELFLKYDPRLPGTTVFRRGTAWVRLVHFIEPRMKRAKEQFFEWRRRILTANGDLRG
jgi:LmbE family N-acetylglucosaminyl deacetylase